MRPDRAGLSARNDRTEFQFGMNWSAYSRFVGDVFGAPLAMEGLRAFFVESVFLGLWIFGWGKGRTYRVFRKRLSRSNIGPVDAIPTAVRPASLAAGQP